MAQRHPLPIAQSTDLNEIFRTVVDQSGLTRYEIAKRLKIADSSRSRSYNGQQGVPWLLLQRVAEVAGMRVVAKVERS